MQIKHVRTEILDWANYFSWQAQFLTLLQACDLFDFLNGKIDIEYRQQQWGKTSSYSTGYFPQFLHPSWPMYLRTQCLPIFGMHWRIFLCPSRILWLHQEGVLVHDQVYRSNKEFNWGLGIDWTIDFKRRGSSYHHGWVGARLWRVINVVVSVGGIKSSH